MGLENIELSSCFFVLRTFVTKVLGHEWGEIGCAVGLIVFPFPIFSMETKKIVEKHGKQSGTHAKAQNK